MLKICIWSESTSICKTLLRFPQELRAKLDATRDAADLLKKQTGDCEAEKRSLQDQITALKEELDFATREKHEAIRDASRYKSSVAVVGR